MNLQTPFPPDPSLGQKYKQWTWNGSQWVCVRASTMNSSAVARWFLVTNSAISALEGPALLGTTQSAWRPARSRCTTTVQGFVANDGVALYRRKLQSGLSNCR